METKSLYTILGVRPDASSDQIESTYAEILHRLKDGSEANPGGDDRVKLIAAKEAYDVLSNPVSRQRYNQRLFAPQAIETTPTFVIEPDNSWGIGKLLTIGVIVVAAIWLYSHFSVEKERMLIEHDKEMADKQLQLEQERQQQQEANQEAQLQLQKAAQERAVREAAIRESREVDYRLAQNAREEQQRQQREAREKQYQQQQEEARQRQQKYEAERQLEREKQALRNLQNENRRGVGYY